MSFCRKSASLAIGTLGSFKHHHAYALMILATLACRAGAPTAEEDDALSMVLVGAGDIADCDDPNDEATALLLDNISGTVFTTGDNAYEDGTPDQFANCYQPSWGAHRDRTRPSPGNHDYHTSGAAGYYDYFGSNAGDPTTGYYSYDLGAWHIIALNSNIQEDAGSPQLQWLAADLASSGSLCTLAYWHHPRFSSGSHGNDSSMEPFWDALYAAGADVIINGHDHDYERFALQTPDGDADPEFGIREFVVGTGGRNLRDLHSVRPNSEVRESNTYGVLKFDLFDTSYEWEFIPVAGSNFNDRGTTDCH